MKLKEMQEARAAALKAANDIRAVAKEEDRALTDDEAGDIEEMLGKADVLDDEITEARAKQHKTLAGRIDKGLESLDKPNGRQSPPAPPAQPGQTPGATVHDLREDDPMRGFKSERDFLLSVLQAGLTGGRNLDERLKPLAVVGSDEQGEFSDPFGGFLLPTGFITNLLSIRPELDPTVGRTMMIPMTAPRVEIPARVDENHSSSVSGGLSVSRRAETDTTAASRIEFQKVALQATSLLGISFVTEELLADSPISMAALLEQGFRDEFGSKLFDEKLFGTGTGEYEGVNNSPALVTVAKEGSQVADTIVYNNILKMRSRQWNYQNAIWLANHDTFPQLAILELPVGTGGTAIYIASAIEDRPDLLLGRPIFYTESMKKLGDESDIGLYDYSQYLEGVLMPLRGDESVHVRFNNLERTFRFWTRNDGRGWWKSPLTPKNGAATLSPFVTLAERA